MLRSLDYAMIGALVYDPEAGVVAADESFCAIVRRPLSQVMGKRMEDLTSLKDVPANAWLLDTALKTLQSFTMRKRYRLLDSTEVWVENRYTVVERADRHPLVSMLCRPVSGPFLDKPNSHQYSGNLAYIASMAEQLALLARQANNELVSDLMELSKIVIEADEAS